MAVGGAIIEITYNHPDLGTGVFYPKSSEDSTYDLGGYRSDDEDTGVDGGGNMIVIINAVRWSVEGTISSDMNQKMELERLVALSASPIDADWTFTHINGTVYGGKGRPVGDLKHSGNAATMPIKISGGGTLNKV